MYSCSNNKVNHQGTLVYSAIDAASIWFICKYAKT